jgi:DNA-binding transcriptional ArsR family regulator
MSRLLPFKSEATSTPDEPRVLDLGDEATDAALSALSSETARKILATVYEEPKTPPEIRDEVGTSLQNVHYHVEQLSDADLIERAGTGYSEKGTEMTVYGPANQAFVLFAGKEHDRSRLKSALSRLLGSVGLLALASYAVQRFVESTGTNVQDVGDGLGPAATDGGDPGGGAGAATDTDTPVRQATDTAGIRSTPEAGPDPTRTVEATGKDTAVPTPSDPGTTSPTAADTQAPSGTPGPSGTPAPEGTPLPTGTPSETATPIATDTATAAADTPTAQVGTEAPNATATATSTPMPDGGTTETARQAAESGADGLLADPGVAFFVGGLFMIGVLATWWYLQG